MFCERGAGNDRGTRSSSERLKYDGGINPEFLGLHSGEKSKIMGWQHDRRREKLRCHHPGKRLLVGSTISYERQELLWHGVA